MGNQRRNEVIIQEIMIKINSLQDIKEAKLKVFSNVDQVEPPQDKGLKYFIKGVTDEMRADYRKNLLAVTKDVKRLSS
jgi:Zn-dependent M16 (insulinase) family peptidase